MQDLFEGTAFYGISKDDFTQLRAIRLAVGTKYLVAERGADRLLNTGILGEQFMPAAVGVENFDR